MCGNPEFQNLSVGALQHIFVSSLRVLERGGGRVDVDFQRTVDLKPNGVKSFNPFLAARVADNLGKYFSSHMVFYLVL